MNNYTYEPKTFLKKILIVMIPVTPHLANECLDKFSVKKEELSWPKVNKRFGNKIWIKHENHTSIGSFKIRSSLNLIRVKSKKNDSF